MIATDRGKQIVNNRALGGGVGGEDSDHLKRIGHRAGLLLFCFTLVALSLYGLGAAAAVVLGGVLAYLNMKWLTAGVDHVLTGRGAGRTGPILIGFMARLVLILVCLFAMIQISSVSLLATVLGLSIYVIAELLEAVFLLLRK